VAVLFMIAAGAFGLSVFDSLSAGGMHDPTAESSRASELLSEKFGHGDMEMLITVSSDEGAQAPGATEVGVDLVKQLQDSPDVGRVLSPWTVNPAAAQALISKDGKTGLIMAGITGGESQAQNNAKLLADEIVGDRDGVRLRDGGEATVYWQVNEQTEKDLLFVEMIAMPLSFLVLVWIFGGVIAAALPVVLGGFAILGAMASLHAISLFTDVSVFALNLTVAMGMALAIDYTLLILSRYRDELAEGRSRDAAVIRTMATAGRTVVFSAVTVALSMATMVVFPQYFLRSFAYAGVTVVAFAATASIVVTPAAIVLLGDRLDSLDVRPLIRRVFRRSPPRVAPVQQWFWYRWTTAVMRHAVPVGLSVIVLLLVLGAPFLDVRWGFPDDRVLPTTASARQVGDDLRSNFPGSGVPDITIVLPDATGLSPADLDGYAAALSGVGDVTSVSSPGGTFVAGLLAGPPSGPSGLAEGSAFLTVTSSAPLFSAASAVQLDRLHAVPTPDHRPVQLAGIAQNNRDSVHAVTSRVPLVLGIIAVITMVLVFLLTGSVVLPVKAVLMNMLSLTAAFGALVWVFQEGHLGALGTAVTGTLDIVLPVLLFCIAFGLSMDYEVFLLSRIREYWLSSDQGPTANDDSVALGVAHTGRVITAAALIMAISFAALIAAQVSFMRLFGLGLTVAVLVDATLVRMLLVPAFMRVFGRVNWWAPKPLVHLHDRFGLSDSAEPQLGERLAVRVRYTRRTTDGTYQGRGRQRVRHGRHRRRTVFGRIGTAAGRAARRPHAGRARRPAHRPRPDQPR
jgi:RND superfamily putative drug exporter